ncbi:MAG: CDGSH iron-sulfur domain-containing protein [Candidatus Nanopelagicales bacterium]
MSENTEVTITPLVDGPLEVKGLSRVTDCSGNIIEESQRAYLCRCGASNKKPFCDGSHKRVGFTASD